MLKLIFSMLFLSVTIFSSTVEININPIDSKIFINSKKVSSNNGKVKLDLKEGNYNILIVKNNYLSQEFNFWLTDKSQFFNIKLKAHKIDFKIKSNTKDSIIKINNQKIDKKTPLIFYNEGKITIEESLKDHKTTSKTLNVKLGNSYLVELPKLEELPTNLSVVGNLKDSSIRLDGVEVAKGELLLFNRAKLGKHHILVSHNGYKSFEKEIVLTSLPMSINYELEEISPKLQLGAGLSYRYGYIFGGVPEFNLFVLVDKIKIKLDLLYVVNSSSDLEYYGLAVGGQYKLFSRSIFSFYLGGDFLFSKFLDKDESYNEYGIGLNLVSSIKPIKELPLYIDFDLTSRFHYTEDNSFDIFGKLSINYLF